MLTWIVVAICIAGLVDRLLLACEARGWIYYRRKKALSSGCANAWIEVHALFEQAAQERIERRIRHENDGEEDDENQKPPPPRLQRASSSAVQNGRSNA